MLKLFLLTLAFLAIAVVFFSVRILLKKDGKFSSEHVGQSKAMRDKGIHCIQTQDKIERSKPQYKLP